MRNGPGLAAEILHASLALMSILVAVVTIIAVEYKTTQSDEALAWPIWWSLVGTTGATVCSGVLALVSLLYIHFGWTSTGWLIAVFALLIAAISGGTVYVVMTLIA